MPFSDMEYGASADLNRNETKTENYLASVSTQQKEPLQQEESQCSISNLAIMSLWLNNGPQLLSIMTFPGTKSQALRNINHLNLSWR